MAIFKNELRAPRRAGQNGPSLKVWRFAPWFVAWIEPDARLRRGIEITPLSYFKRPINTPIPGAAGPERRQIDALRRRILRAGGPMLYGMYELLLEHTADRRALRWYLMDDVTGLPASPAQIAECIGLDETTRSSGAISVARAMSLLAELGLLIEVDLAPAIEADTRPSNSQGSPASANPPPAQPQPGRQGDGRRGSTPGQPAEGMGMPGPSESLVELPGAAEGYEPTSRPANVQDAPGGGMEARGSPPQRATLDGPSGVNDNRNGNSNGNGNGNGNEAISIASNGQRPIRIGKEENGQSAPVGNLQQAREGNGNGNENSNAENTTALPRTVTGTGNVNPAGNQQRAGEDASRPITQSASGEAGSVQQATTPSPARPVDGEGRGPGQRECSVEVLNEDGSIATDPITQSASGEAGGGTATAPSPARPVWESDAWTFDVNGKPLKKVIEETIESAFGGQIVGSGEGTPDEIIADDSGYKFGLAMFVALGLPCPGIRYVKKEAGAFGSRWKLGLCVRDELFKAWVLESSIKAAIGIRTRKLSLKQKSKQLMKVCLDIIQGAIKKHLADRGGKHG